MKNPYRNILIGVLVVLGIVAVFIFVPMPAGPTLPARLGEVAFPQVAASERVQTFAVENMYCGSCPYIVREAIASVKGVRAVKVDFANKTATVIYDPSVTSVEAIANAPTSVGYPARMIGS